MLAIPIQQALAILDNAIDFTPRAEPLNWRPGERGRYGLSSSTAGWIPGLRAGSYFFERSLNGLRQQWAQAGNFKGGASASRYIAQSYEGGVIATLTATVPFIFKLPQQRALFITKGRNDRNPCSENKALRCILLLLVRCLWQ